MKLLVYSAKKFEVPFLERANKNNYHVVFTHKALDSETAYQAVGFDAISIFSGDDASLTVLEKLRDFGVKYITLGLRLPMPQIIRPMPLRNMPWLYSWHLIERLL